MDMERMITLIILVFIWIYFAILLIGKEDGYGSALTQAVLLFYWSYMGHVWGHQVSAYFPFNIIQTHVSFHHGELKYVPRWFEIMVEAINNFMGFISIYLLHAIVGIKLFNLKIILYSGFLYTGVHIFYYTILTDNKYHQVHHGNPSYNYSPELLDIIFNTKKYDENYEKISLIHQTIPALLSYHLVKYIFKFL